jgi:KaiC/GvpD/RAD55 family RecA-like ATPase
MKVRVLRPFVRFRSFGPAEPNQILDLPDADAEALVRNGLAEPLEGAPEAGRPERRAISYEKLARLTEHHLAEIYGAYGVGKSRLAHHIAVEAQEAGKRVLYVDTEGGLLEEHAKMLKNYWYVGDSVEALEDAVAWAREHRNDFDLLVVDSVGHPVYVNYVEMETMDQKLKAYQRLAAVFRDMVRFARGERGVDFQRIGEPSKRRALALAVNHPVSEFAKMSKDLPPEEPLAPFGGQIHRVPKAILRAEPVEMRKDRTVGSLLSYKLRGLPRDLEVARYVIKEGVGVEWKV